VATPWLDRGNSSEDQSGLGRGTTCRCHTCIGKGRRANETIQLRTGAGEMILSGLSQSLAAGQTVEVTLEFAYADSVTVQIPVVSAG
jgi:hypothetical protein